MRFGRHRIGHPRRCRCIATASSRAVHNLITMIPPMASSPVGRRARRTAACPVPTGRKFAERPLGQHRPATAISSAATVQLRGPALPCSDEAENTRRCPQFVSHRAQTVSRLLPLPTNVNLVQAALVSTTGISKSAKLREARRCRRIGTRGNLSSLARSRVKRLRRRSPRANYR